MRELVGLPDPPETVEVLPHEEVHVIERDSFLRALDEQSGGLLRPILPAMNPPLQPVEQVPTAEMLALWLRQPVDDMPPCSSGDCFVARLWAEDEESYPTDVPPPTLPAWLPRNQIEARNVDWDKDYGGLCLPCITEKVMKSVLVYHGQNIPKSVQRSPLNPLSVVCGIPGEFSPEHVIQASRGVANGLDGDFYVFERTHWSLLLEADGWAVLPRLPLFYLKGVNDTSTVVPGNAPFMVARPSIVSLMVPSPLRPPPANLYMHEIFPDLRFLEPVEDVDKMLVNTRIAAIRTAIEDAKESRSLTKSERKFRGLVPAPPASVEAMLYRLLDRHTEFLEGRHLSRNYVGVYSSARRGADFKVVRFKRAPPWIVLRKHDVSDPASIIQVSFAQGHMLFTQYSWPDLHDDSLFTAQDLEKYGAPGYTHFSSVMAYLSACYFVLGALDVDTPEVVFNVRKMVAALVPAYVHWSGGDEDITRRTVRGVRVLDYYWPSEMAGVTEDDVPVIPRRLLCVDAVKEDGDRGTLRPLTKILVKCEPVSNTVRGLGTLVWKESANDNVRQMVLHLARVYLGGFTRSAKHFPLLQEQALIFREVGGVAALFGERPGMTAEETKNYVKVVESIMHEFWVTITRDTPLWRVYEEHYPRFGRWVRDIGHIGDLVRKDVRDVLGDNLGGTCAHERASTAKPFKCQGLSFEAYLMGQFTLMDTNLMNAADGKPMNLSRYMKNSAAAIGRRTPSAEWRRTVLEPVNANWARSIMEAVRQCPPGTLLSAEALGELGVTDRTYEILTIMKTLYLDKGKNQQLINNLLLLSASQYRLLRTVASAVARHNSVRSIPLSRETYFDMLRAQQFRTSPGLPAALFFETSPWCCGIFKSLHTLTAPHPEKKKTRADENPYYRKKKKPIRYDNTSVGSSRTTSALTADGRELSLCCPTSSTREKFYAAAGPTAHIDSHDARRKALSKASALLLSFPCYMSVPTVRSPLLGHALYTEMIALMTSPSANNVRRKVATSCRACGAVLLVTGHHPLASPSGVYCYHCTQNLAEISPTCAICDSDRGVKVTQVWSDELGRRARQRLCWGCVKAVERRMPENMYYTFMGTLTRTTLVVADLRYGDSNLSYRCAVCCRRPVGVVRLRQESRPLPGEVQKTFQHVTLPLVQYPWLGAEEMGVCLKCSLAVKKHGQWGTRGVVVDGTLSLERARALVDVAPTALKRVRRLKKRGRKRRKERRRL